MKISQKQATLLAKEVVNQLKAKKAQKVSETTVTQIKEWAGKRKELWDKKNDAQEEINRHEMLLKKIIGTTDRIYGSESVAQIIERMEQKNIPKVQEIEDEIILKSMFATEDDLQKFLDTIVSKYTKKLQAKILQN